MNIEKETSTKNSFGIWLRERRIAKKLTGEKLAERLGVHYVTLNNWERGKQTPHSGKIIPLARALGVDPRELWNALLTTMPGIEGTERPTEPGGISTYQEPTLPTILPSRLQARFMAAAAKLERADQNAFLECAAEILQRAKAIEDTLGSDQSPITDSRFEP